MHISEDLKKIFLVTSSGEIRGITEEIVDFVVESEDPHVLRVISECAVGDNVVLGKKRLRIEPPVDSVAVSLPFKHKVMICSDGDNTWESTENVMIVQSPPIIPIRHHTCVKLIQTKNEAKQWNYVRTGRDESNLLL